MDVLTALNSAGCLFLSMTLTSALDLSINITLSVWPDPTANISGVLNRTTAGISGPKINKIVLLLNVVHALKLQRPIYQI